MASFWESGKKATSIEQSYNLIESKIGSYVTCKVFKNVRPVENSQ